jgi:hypothetical protein
VTNSETANRDPDGGLGVPTKKEPFLFINIAGMPDFEASGQISMTNINPCV